MNPTPTPTRSPAARNDAPILLTQRDGVPAATADALAELDPATVVVLGGTDTVTDATYAELGGTLRVEGEDRYATGVAVSSGLEPGVDVVYVASGLDYPDGLAGSALAGAQDAAVLLTRQDELSTATAAELTRLEPASVIVLGGTEAVSEATYTQIEALFADD